MRNKENIKIDAYAFIERLKEYPKFDYREAMRALYYIYQNSKGWEYVSKEVRKRDNNRCRDCGQTEGKLTVHHTSYDNWGFGDFGEINDCILVCQKCHNKRHRDNSVKVPFWATRNNMMSRERQEEVNQMEEEINI